MANKKAKPKRKQVRDWDKVHTERQVRLAAKKEGLDMLVRHHNELLARFFGIKAFDSSVANRVDAELSAQLRGEYR